MCIWPCAILAAYWLGRTYQKSKMDEVLPPVKRSIPPIPTEELRARAQEVLEEIEKGHINWPGRIQLTQPLAEELYVKLGYRALHGHASGPTLDDMELMVIRKQVQIQSTAHH